MRSTAPAILAAFSALAVASTPARAHVTLEAQQATAGSTYRAVFRVPHGCEGHAATTRLLRLPEEPGLFYIPAVQDCAGGGRSAWEQVPEPGRRASDYPFIAPAVRLTPRN